MIIRPNACSVAGLLKRQIAALRVAKWNKAQLIWNPFGRHGSQDFWVFLKSQAPERAYRELLALGGSEVKSDCGLLINLEGDSDTVLKLSGENEAFAVFFAELISGTQNGFFPFAYRLMELFPASKAVSSALISAATRQSGAAVNLDPYQKLLVAIEGEKSNPGVPSHFAPWLEEVKQRIQEELKPWRSMDPGEEFLGWD